MNLGGEAGNDKSKEREKKRGKERETYVYIDR